MSVQTQVLSPREHEIEFFRAIKRDLNFIPTEQLIKTLRLVATAIRKGTDPIRLAELGKKLPSTIRWILLDNKQLVETHKPILHLDELVENVYAEDAISDKKLFATEVDALASTVIIVKYFTLLFDSLGINIFPYSMCHECQQAVGGR